MAHAMKENQASGPPPGVTGGPPAGAFEGTTSGLEGREEELGRGISVVIKTMKNTMPYPHEMNDALVKQHLTIMQFAKDKGLVDEFIAHDRKTMSPLNSRVGMMIEKTGNAEFALVALCERTACHYHLVLDTHSEPGKRSWKSPFGHVLEASTRLGQFDMTEQWIHENWVVPKLRGYAEDMGVDLNISDWNDDGSVTIELA